MKGIEQIKWLCYGNHPQTSEYRDIAEEIINFLRRDEELSRKRLMELLDMNPESEKDKDKFYNILRPLRGNKGSNPLDITVISTYERDGNTFYYLSREGYDASVNSMNGTVRYALD